MLLRLLQMLSVLERKERMVQAEVDLLEYHEANREWGCASLSPLWRVMRRRRPGAA